MTHIPVTSINATKGIGEVISYTNSVTNTWFSNMILIAIYILVLIGYYKAQNDFKGAMAVAGFGTFVVGLLLWLGGMVSGVTFAIAIAVCILGVAVLMMD